MVEGQVSQEDLELQEQNLFDNARFSVPRGYFAVRPWNEQENLHREV